MHVAKVLARLNGKTQTFAVGTVGGVPPLLTDANVGAMLARLHYHGAQLYGRVKYAQQGLFWPALVTVTTRMVCALPEAEGWELDHKRALRLAITALKEGIAPYRCPECKGRGERMRRKLRVSCHHCGGHGILPYSERWRARSIGVNWYQYRTYWSIRYHHTILPVIDGYETQLWRGIQRQV